MKMLQTGRRASVELHFRSTDRWLMVTVDPVRDQKGNLIGSVHITRDITERKNIERRLRDSEERYRYIYEQSPVGIGLATVDGKVVSANKTMEVITGYFEEELKKINLADTYENPQDRKRLLETIERYGCAVDFPVQKKRKDGTVYDALLNISRVRFGDQELLQTICMDVTERKRAEQQIAKLAKFPAEDPNPVLRISKDYKILYANRASSVILETWGRKVGESVIGGPQDCCNRVAEALSSGKVSTFEFVCRDGRTFELTLAPIVESGYVNVYGLDITAHKQAMEQIEKLARFPAEDPNPVLRVSGYGTVVYGNKSSEPLLKLWRCRVGGSLSGCWYDLVLDALSCGQNQQMEVQCGEQIFSITFVPVMESNYVNIYGRDITKRKRAEDVVRNSHDYLVRLTNSTWDAIFSVKMPERVIEWVNNSVRLIGYEPQECVNKTTEFLYPNKNEYLDFGKKLTQAIEAGEDVLHAEQLLRRKNGEVFPAEITTTFFKAKGEVIRITSIVRDITERKKSEERLLEYQKQLKNLASQLSLTEERERRRIGEGLHDDIIQPLAFLDIKLDSLKKSLRQQNLMAKPLIESCNEMQKTIREPIKITRAFTFDLSSPILYELGLEAAIEEWLATNIRKKYGIETVFEDDGESKPLDDDMCASLFKAVKELLVNVVKHARASSVKVSVARYEDNIKIDVEDNGAGFYPVKKKDLSGYGLFSIRERLDHLGGSFDIDSKPNQGTRVTLTAPLKLETISEKGNNNEH
jgi:PAS domain S-box-containing protein